MKEWEIYLSDKKITVRGKTLNSAVKAWGKKHIRTKIECGLLVRVKYDGLYSYWSGKRFLELVGKMK